MRKLLLIILVISGLSATAWISFSDLRKVNNDAFVQGEFLKYKVHYGFINAGYCELKVDTVPHEINERRCLHIVGKGYTNSTFDIFYKVRDVYESYIDMDALVSWKFKRLISEGKYYSYTETHFDHYNNQADYVNRKKKIITHEVPPNIQDVISAFYYARARYDHSKLKPGDKISLRNFIDEKTVNLQAKMLKRETIKVNGQKYNTIKFNLNIEEAGLITDGSKIFMWISDDKNKIPVRIASELLIGKLKADLIESKGLKHPLNLPD